MMGTIKEEDVKDIFAIIALLASCTLSCRADTVYTYTGKLFTSCGLPSLCGDYIYGSFTLAAPLPPNRAYGYLAPLSAGFSGGFGYPADPLFEPIAIIDVATGADGNITAWYLNFFIRPYSYLISFNVPGQQITDPVTQSLVNQSDQLALGYGGSNANMPGTWTITQNGIPLTPTPEPATLLLACTAILALPFYLRAHPATRRA